tara:strand:+ start:11 stop:124 length:114 start_codon:yes stop_codon:yes gene_type:complete
VYEVFLNSILLDRKEVFAVCKGSKGKTKRDNAINKDN